MTTQLCSAAAMSPLDRSFVDAILGLQPDAATHALESDRNRALNQQVPAGSNSVRGFGWDGLVTTWLGGKGGCVCDFPCQSFLGPYIQVSQWQALQQVAPARTLLFVAGSERISCP